MLKNELQRAVENTRQNRLIDIAAIKIRRKLQSELIRAGKAAAASYKVIGDAGFGKIITEHKNNIKKIMLPSIEKTYMQFGGRAFNNLKSYGIYEIKTTEADFELFLDGYLELFAAEKVVAITETTRNIINAAIVSSIGEASIETTAEVIATRTRGISAYRSAVISRTEMHAASQSAQDAAAKSLQIEYKKRWIASFDERTRPTHEKAHGQQVKPNEAFIVGNSRLMYAGDPSGEAAEVIQCRCVSPPVPI